MSRPPTNPRKKDKGPRRVRSGDVVEGVVREAGDNDFRVETPRGDVRVRAVVPGDRLRVRVTHVGRNAMWGKLAEAADLLTPSEQRVEPRCPLVADCGGCPWQAWGLASQRAEKWRRLAGALRQVPGPPIQQVVGVGDGYGHRNKLLVAVGGRVGSLRFGLYAPRSHELVPAEGCPVHVPEGDAALSHLRRVLEQARVPPWDEKQDRGLLKHLLVRVAPGTNQIGVVLVVRSPLRDGPALAKRLLEVPGVVSVWENHNPRRTSVALAPGGRHLAGRPRLLAEVAGTRYLFSPAAFFQTNTPGLPLLVETVRAAVPKRFDHLIDLYAGVGLFSLALAPQARRVTAVEQNRLAAADLEAAARLQGRRNIRVKADDAANARKPSNPPDVLVVDPPRSGLSDKGLERVSGDLRPRRLVYVSCGPAALGRDLLELTRRGFRIRSIQPLDLFPHTPHLETVVALDGR